MNNQEDLDSSNNKNVSLSLLSQYGASDSDSDETETQANENHDEGDSDVGMSDMVLRNNLINACVHAPPRSGGDNRVEIFRQIIDSLENSTTEYEVTEYRDEDSSDSDSSDSEIDSIKDVEEISSGDEAEAGKNGKAEAPKAHGELGLDDLPPIEDLAISLPSEETTKIGTVASIVDRLVIVRAFPDTPAVDLDSVLFLEKGAKALGKVFDVFGPVSEPHYCVRFNSIEHVKERGVNLGMEVYIAPKSQHTSYVFLSELMKIKGSDASWLHDVEPPPQHVEFSDDEEERRASRARKEQNRQKHQEESETDGETSRNKKPERKNQRPSESSSRFGSGPSRGRNPFSSSRRNQNQCPFPRFARPFPQNQNEIGPLSAPPGFHAPPMFPPPFLPNTPPMNVGNPFQFGGGPRIPPLMGPPPFRFDGGPVFGGNFCNMPPQWGPPPPNRTNRAQPPPPGT